MKTFISWSGKRSRYIAEELSNWLEQVLQAVEPWISSDIEKGKRWSNEIAEKLSDSKVAIICLTKDNLDSSWIHFEAGAISKTPDSYVCTFLFGVTPANVKQPLSQFQSTKAEKNDILKLLKTINSKIGQHGGKSLKESNLEAVFETFWPQLEEKLSHTPESNDKEIDPRSDRDLLEESLQLLRNIKNNISSTILSEVQENEILDYWLDKFAKLKELKYYNSWDLQGKESEIIKFIEKVPETRILFGTKLEEKITSRIREQAPF